MPARWMQQKLVKMKRMRRAALKKYVDHGNKSRDYMKGYGYFQDLARSRVTESTGIDGKPILSNGWMQPIAVKNSDYNQGEPLADKLLERPRAFRPMNDHRILEVWATDRLQKVEEYIRGPLLQDFKGIRIWCYFCGAKYILLKEGKTFFSVSIVYDDRLEAYEAWMKDRIIWNYHEDRPA